jgi:hypothetical protein
MSRTSQSGLAAQKTPAPAPIPKSQFDTFETKFFEQGEAGHGADGERFEEWEEPTRSTRRSATRPFLLGVAVGSISVAVLGGVGLWLAGAGLGRAPAPPSAEAVAAKVEPMPAPPSAALPAGEPGAPAPAAPAPAVAPTPAAHALPAVAEPVAVPAEEPASEPVAVPAEKPASEPVAVAEPAASPAVASCRKALDRKRSKDVLAHCPAAFSAAPAADIAAALAKIEFDRGRGARAVEWGKQSIALDENNAEAYVFIGGGEQLAGHDKAAKEAYRRYLELAPKGRYAADVRAIVGK